MPYLQKSATKMSFLELHDRTERFAVWINPMWSLSITWVNLFYRWRICFVDRKSLLMTQCLILNCFVSFCAGCQFVETPVISRWSYQDCCTVRMFCLNLHCGLDRRPIRPSARWRYPAWTIVIGKSFPKVIKSLNS